MMNKIDHSIIERWVNDWCLFAEEAMELTLDEEQQDILRAVQNNKMVSVTSGTARGKDLVAAVAAMCFLYLMPGEDEKGQLESTKVALTAPTDAQVKNIMMPEVSKLYHKLKRNGICPNNARLQTYDIRTDYKDLFLTGFVSDEHNHEAWSGFHAVNTMFIVTEGSGISESVFSAIEGNLQGNSRLLIVFNNNTGTGYAANSQRSPRFKKFRLNSLNAPNVLKKKVVIPGQVDYDWVLDKVKTWCVKIDPKEFNSAEGDFEFDINEERNCYRPNDLFRVKVLGLAPKVSTDVLIPMEWIELANKRHNDYMANKTPLEACLRLAVDVAGMGTDSTCFCYRHGNYVEKFEVQNSNGEMKHMAIAGKISSILKGNSYSQTFVDTIGEGAGVYDRLQELVTGTPANRENNPLNIRYLKGAPGFRLDQIFSVKGSTKPEWENKTLHDLTGQHHFLNMRAYMYWCVRDWLNPANNSTAMLPYDEELAQELTETKWEFMSDGKIKIEKKEDLKKRIKRSPDKADSLAMTFFPVPDFATILKREKEHRLNMQKLLSFLPG
jgi:hypothetical protein